MYVKIFESRQSSNSYIVQHDISLRGLDHGQLYIENQDKKRIKINENELFSVIDKLFMDNQGDSNACSEG